MPSLLQAGRLYALLGLILIIVMTSTPARSANWLITPDVDIAEEYNSNVLYSRKEKIDDFITSFRPRLRGERRSEVSRAGLDIVLSGEKYLMNPELDAIDADCQAALERKWSERLQTMFSAGFAHDQTLETELEAAGLASARSDRFRYSAGSSADYALSERWFVSGSFGFRFDHYPDDVNPDLQSLFASFGPGWKMNEKNTINGSIAVSQADYETETLDRTVSASLAWLRNLSETQSFQLSAGWRYSIIDIQQIIPRLFIRPDGTIGIRTVTIEEEATDSGLIFSLSLNKAWTDRLSTSLSSGREHYNRVDGSSVERNYIRTSTSFRLSERTTLSGDLGYDLSTAIGETDEETHYIRASNLLSYRLTPRATLRLGCSYEHSLEDEPTDSFNRSRFKSWLSFTYNWPDLWTSQ